MIIRENIPLASLTTLRVGGSARYVAECTTEEEVVDALAFASKENLPWRVLGEGSNVLADDAGYPGVVLRMQLTGIESVEETDTVTLTASAGVAWDSLVRAAAAQSLWGIENLAGIPGTVGAAPVQNIGAYGMEAKDTIKDVRVFDTKTKEIRVLLNEECGFGYRESRFKHDPSLIILSVSFRLQKEGSPSLGYKDLTALVLEGRDLSTPATIGDAVRSVRARKFPDLTVCGTAGSFFKNPTISEDAYAVLKKQYPELPGFPHAEGVKIPLAFVLDHVLQLRGYTEGNVSLFMQQPLVLVAHTGATAGEIDAFANAIAARVTNATGITVEREVQRFMYTQ